MKETGYLLVGIVIGWVTKVPFLIKWYRELRETNDYKKRKTDAYLKHFENLKQNT